MKKICLEVLAFQGVHWRVIFFYLQCQGILIVSHAALFYCNRRWLRSAVFLVVIMGITWIVGVLIVEVDALLPLAYIYTIMVAFQGLFIFLIFVVFSKQVSEASRKWWKSKVNESTVLSRCFGGDSVISRSVSYSIIKDSPCSVRPCPL